MFSEQNSIEILQHEVSPFPETVVILGSGWNKILSKIKIECEIDYEVLFGVQATVPGHVGKLMIAKIGKKRVAFMSGRLHMYEGYSAREATSPIRVFASLGMKNLILTSASGALNEKYKVGDFVVISDLLTLFMSLDNPLIGPEFLDMSSVFCPDWRLKAMQILATEKIVFHEGVYCYYHGPNYETPADKMALRFLGADVVGMSVVPETIMARSLNVNVLGLSFVTNLAFVKHDHTDVVAQANKASAQMSKLLLGLLST